ncbi:enoyl-CoA hydratase-related protein [Microbacterium sp. A93]|uniref:enoyl-CoA hydratase-related protein n=1 Tax=Microbacterium sp. A93 TaxID=3450716 RepID=UPI003F43F932
MTFEFDHLLLDRVGTDGRIGRITINRPDKRNALAPETLEQLIQALDQFETDQDVRVIILRGAGSGFSSGYDLTRSYTPGGEGIRTKDDADRPLTFNHGVKIGRGTAAQLRLFHVSKPTVIQIHGFALAGGLELAMMGDLVTASEDAVIGHPGHRAIGVSRNGMILPYILNMRKAKELFFTGDAVTGKTAEEIGLINYAWPADELEERTIAFADRIANLSADFLGVLKLGINTFYENMGLQSSMQTLTHLDATAQHTEAAYEWRDHLSADGLKGALAWRDGRYGDYSAAPRREAD